eukprot:3682407-Pleurochrysis_carterae.AAC.1
MQRTRALCRALAKLRVPASTSSFLFDKSSPRMRAAQCPSSMRAALRLPARADTPRRRFGRSCTFA